MSTKWYVDGNFLCNTSGLNVRIQAADDRSHLAEILNDLEKMAAFGWQCYQDQCEGAWVEVSVHRKVVEELCEVKGISESNLECVPISPHIADQVAKILHEWGFKGYESHGSHNDSEPKESHMGHQMRTNAISISVDAYAKSHQAEHGHPPLIIGREYTYLREPFMLIGAHEDDEKVTVRSGGFEVTTCDKCELRWIEG